MYELREVRRSLGEENEAQVNKPLQLEPEEQEYWVAIYAAALSYWRMSTKREMVLRAAEDADLGIVELRKRTGR